MNILLYVSVLIDTTPYIFIDRFVTTSVYVFFMIVTMILAFYPHFIPLRLMWLVISVLLQFLALIWYSLSYLPFARDLVKSCLINTCCSSCKNYFEVRELRMYASIVYMYRIVAFTCFLLTIITINLLFLCA